MKKFCILICILWVHFLSEGFSQKQNSDITNSKFFKLPDTPSKVDSLLILLSLTKDSIHSIYIFNEAIIVATKTNYLFGRIKALDMIGVAMRNLSNYSQALTYHRTALELAEKSGNLKLKMQILNNIGVVYRRLDDNKIALDFHIKALKIAEKINDTKNICISLNSIGNIYCSIGQNKIALTYFKKALPLEQKRNNLLGVSINLHNIGSVYESLGNLDSALIYYNGSLIYDIQVKKTSGIAICYNSIGEIYIKKRDYKQAMDYFNRALVINQQVNDKIYISVSYTNIAQANLLIKNYDKAIEYFQKGLDISLKIGSKWQTQNAHEGLSHCYEQKGEYKKALSYYKRAVVYADSIINEGNLKHINLLQTQYETEKKEHQIVILKKQKETSNLYIILLIIILLVLISISVFSYKNTLQKRKIVKQELDLKEQKINQLEKEHQLIAAQLVIQGGEAERTRMARDLHDGLGGLLSGVKLALNNMKGNVILSEDNVRDFDRAIDMLDSSIKELRRVAHNMMPEALIKFGLKDTLLDFCQSLNELNEMDIKFQFLGEFLRVDNKLEINVFRILQELVNNAVKHSQAKSLIIQMIQETNRLCFIVSDNGIGFDTELVKSYKGIGLSNIKSRVESMKGLLDVYSKPGEGSEFTIEFSI